MNADPDDRALLLATARGEAHAARMLWARHAPVVRAYVRAVLGVRSGEPSCDDVVQDAFCRVLGADERTLASVENVRAWLLGVARHAGLDAVRRARRARVRDARADVHEPRAAHPGVGSGVGDVDAALAALPRRLREVVVLRHVGGLTFDQVSLALGVPRSTAASRYQAAVDLLRTRLVANEPEPREVRHAS